jgi:hypothetical protein
MTLLPTGLSYLPRFATHARQLALESLCQMLFYYLQVPEEAFRVLVCCFHYPVKWDRLHGWPKPAHVLRYPPDRRAPTDFCGSHGPVPGIPKETVNGL